MSPTTDNPGKVSSAGGEPRKVSFLELPAEIRNRIYGYALPGLDEEYTRDLSCMKDPPLTAVCRQLRNEAFPIFFADCTFEILVHSNFGDRQHLDNNPPTQAVSTYRKGMYRNIGTMGIQRGVTELLKKSGIAATFRNITFNVYRQGTSPSYYRPACTFSVKLAGSSASSLTSTVRIKDPLNRISRSAGLDATIVDVRLVLDTIVEDIKIRSGFLGFSIEDLRRIAGAFRYYPRRQRVKAARKVGS